MKTLGVVDLVDEARQLGGNIGKGLVAGQTCSTLIVFMKLSARALWYGLPAELIEPRKPPSFNSFRCSSLAYWLPRSVW